MNDDRGRAGGEGRKEVEVETDDGETDGSVRSMRWMRKEDELDGGACGWLEIAGFTRNSKSALGKGWVWSVVIG